MSGLCVSGSWLPTALEVLPNDRGSGIDAAEKVRFIAVVGCGFIEVQG